MSPVNRPVAAVAALAFATTAFLQSGSAAAAPPPADRVHNHNLPTLAQVAGIYPGLDDGTRNVVKGRTTAVRSDDCLAYETGPKAASGRWAYYSDSTGGSPYDAGLANPTVFVYKFTTKAKTRAALRTLRSSARGCGGVHSDDSSTITTSMVELPVLGAGRFAFREHQLQDGGFEDYFLDIWVRKGRYLVNTMAQAESFAPGKPNLVKLTRVTLRRTP